ncbi:MAG: hypothetical protein VX875_10135 [Pseudomonadota bacterium]|jgi:hypothetical protein|nr:hypothetical protein [Pseudomonadota bacterium]
MHDKDDDHVKSDMPTQSSSAKKKQTNRSSMAIKSIESINTEQLAQSPRDNSDKTHATTLSEQENDSEASFEIAPEISRSVDYFDTGVVDTNQPNSRVLLNKTFSSTLKRAKVAVNFATDTTTDIVGALGHVTNTTLDTLDQISQHTKNSVLGMRNYSSKAVRGLVTETSEVARSVSLNMAKNFLGNNPITLYLPEVLLNKQIRSRVESKDIDNITVQCGQDQFQIEVDGHYSRVLYRLTLKFDVLECGLGKEKFLRLKQTDEHLDVQVRHAGTMTNWATRRVGKVGFEVINRIPVAKIMNHLIRDIPGIRQEKHRLWYIDLEQAGFIDFINNRSWMTERLISLTDFSILPGLNILRESKELVRQLVDQFEICGLRIQPGRLAIQVSTAPPKDAILSLTLNG